MKQDIKVLSADDAYGVGPNKVLLIGPPGTGKTRAALDSWVFPALHQGVDHQRIGVFSFSTAAASELRERVAKQFGMKPEELREMCSTIHSEALRRISQTQKGLRLYNGITREAQSLSGRRAPNKRIDESHGKPSTVRAAALSIWDYVRNVMKQDDHEFIKSVATKAKASLSGVACSVNTLLGNIAAYEKEKRSEDGGIDFTDMLAQASRSVGREFDLLIVDEAQDCSPLQWKVIEKWAERARNVVLIGDPDQAIHEWAGASPEHFTGHIKKGFEVRKLAQSYRVPRAVHALARKIILRNEDRIDAEYEPKNIEGEVKKLSEKQILDLARSVAKQNDWPYTEEEEIMAEEGGYDLPEPVPALMLLARDRRGCQRYAKLLTDHGVPFTNERGPCLHTSSSKLAVVLGALELKRSGIIRHRNAKHLLTALPVRGKDFWLEPKTQVLERLTKAKYTEDDLKAIGVDLSSMTEMEILTAVHSTKMKINSHQAELAILMANTYGIDCLEMPPNITVTTMHASKGREAETVVLSAQKPFPVQLTYNDRKKREIDAERRTLYVGVTRARQTLIIDKTGKSLYSELL